MEAKDGMKEKPEIQKRQCYCMECPWCKRFEDNKRVQPENTTLKEKLGAAKVQNAEMLELLRELEWAYGDDRYDNVCAVCDSLEPDGHAADCKLGNLLACLNI
jgi:hypothetical protein